MPIGIYERTEKYRKSCTGENNSNWKGGIIKKALGYVGVKSPSHPFRDKAGYVLEHRLVMEKHLGRFLSKNEIVHHLNHDKRDNRIKNLVLISSQSEHAKMHKFGKEIIGNRFRGENGKFKRRS